MLWQDLRFGLRSLRRDLALTLVAMFTLALGIAMATTMFSVFNAIAIDEREVRRADDVMVLWTASPRHPTEHLPLSFTALNAYARESHAFDAIAGVIFQGAVGVVMTDGARVVPLDATWVTGNFFPVLGVVPIMGRLLEPADDAVGAAPVMVISHALWQQQYGGSAAVIGQHLEFDAKRFTIVGVLPAGFEYPKHADAWLPVLPSFPATLEAGPDGPDVMVFDAVGRLGTGVNRAAAAAEFTAYLRQSDVSRRPSSRGAIAVVTSLRDRVSGDIRGTLLAASAAVGLLLLVACVNVANLLFIRGALRSEELAIRRALGAGRMRLARQMLTEATLLATVSGCIAIALSFVAVRVIRALAPPDIPHRALISVDGRVLLFALLVTVLTTICSGLLPSVLGARGDLGPWLRSGRAMSGVHRLTQRIRLGLVVGQIALAVVVLTSAGLITRSLQMLQGVDPGFDHTSLRIVETLLPPDAAQTRDAQLATQERMLAHVLELPGIEAATVLPKPPYSAEGGWMAPFHSDGQSDVERAGNPVADFEVVGATFFQTLALPLIAGRAFTAADRDGAQPVVIVSASVARQTWPGRDPLGQRLKLGSRDNADPWMTVIGVAGETRYRELTTTHPTLYLPALQFQGPVPMTLAIRTRPGSSDMRVAIGRALADAVPALRIVTDASMSERMAAPLARPRFGVALFSATALITMLLCVVGIYGAIGATVRERQPEFGIRLALGEQPAAVRSRILRHAAFLTTSGTALGVAGALVVTRLLRSMIFGVSTVDTVTYVSAVGVILCAAAAACWLPAQRAARVDPMDVLRA